LRRIKEIADAGVSIAGEKPKKLAGHLVSKEDQAEFETLVNHIWSSPNCKETYDFSKFPRDFKVVGEAEKMFMHRRTATEDIYFFSNPDSVSKLYECTFRITNKIPEFWNPVTGEIMKLARFINEGDVTRVSITLDAIQSAFIVFRESSAGVISVVEANDDNRYYLNDDNKIICETAKSGSYSIKLSNGKQLNLTSKQTNEPIDISTFWEVEFLKEHDFAAVIPFSKLTDWKDNSNEAVKYYSGTAIYRKTFNFPDKLEVSQKAILDLGQVNIAAEVWVNGKNAGVLWIAPFKLDISNYLVKGENKLEVHITNQWTNKLIGDERYPKQDDGYKLSSYNPQENSKMPDWFLNNEPIPEGPRTTFDSGQFYKKGDPLLPSGLLGPVSIEFKDVITIAK